jgi:shikimate kinase
VTPAVTPAAEPGVKPERLERVLLVGFMGSGKTTVGRRLARRLGWRFVDFDDEVEAEGGGRVSEIFARHGEPWFRSLEARVAARLLAEREVVLGSGGGWAAAAPGRLKGVPEGTATVWLRVSPEEAVRRAGRRPGARPLLDRPDPLAAARRLAEERTPRYAEARWTVDTEGRSVEDVTAEVLEILAREYPEIRLE